jgi:pyruvate/2-oxoglutarate dehydrogenase complex dihydrolipoamide dehydrogenase (E3) component
MGQSLQRLGCNVTFLLRGSKFMGKEDPEAGQLLKKRLQSEGCTVFTNVRYNNIESANDPSSSPANIDRSSKCKIHL